VDGMRERCLEFDVLDLNRLARSRRAGAFSLAKAWGVIRSVPIYLRLLTRCDIAYMTLGCSTLGFLRDAIFIWIAALANRRVVTHLKGGGYGEFYEHRSWLFQQVIRLTIERADCVIVLGELLREQFAFLRDQSRIHVVYNGLPLKIDPLDCRARRHVAGRPLALLFMSNMILSKGILDVLDAARLLVDEGVEISVKLCGGFVATAVDRSPRELRNVDDLLREVRARALEDVVTYYGVVQGDAKLSVLRESDVFVLPTYYEWEGQPISIIEAMAFGLPVVTTAHKGIPEQVTDGVNGLIVQPRSPRSIADAVRRLCRPDVYEKLSCGAIARYKERFTQEAHLRNLISTIYGDKT